MSCRQRPSPSPPVGSSSVASTPPGTPDYDSSSMLSPKSGNRTGARKESEQRRRLMMNQYFDELITLLAMVSERNIPRKMDKATTLKEAVNCIRVYYELGKAGSPSQEPPKPEPVESDTKVNPPEFKPCFLSGGEILSFFLEARDTFLIIVSESGRILYSTNLITSLLGHMQSRLVGQNIFDYVLEEDKELIIRMLDPTDPSTGVQMPNSPIIQYPCQTFQCHLKLHSGETSLYPQFLPFSCLSFLRQWVESSSQPLSPLETDVATSLNHEQQSCILLLGKLPTSLTVIDLPISTNDVCFEFEMRVSKEGTIIHVDEHAMLVFGFTASELIGSSLFDLIDPYHVTQVGEAMSGFLNTGLGTTTPYRIISKGSRYIWLISKGYLSYDPWNHKPDHILLSNRVLGCDHVLPEHRFFRSRKLLPDVDGEEPYTPSPIQPPVSSPPPVPTPNVSVPYTLPMSSDPILPSPHMSSADLAPPMNNTLPSQPESFMDVQKELERKKQELFDLQRKLLEQQQLIEQERMQFYQVTQQVMQCIGNPSGPSCSSIPPNVQAALGNFSPMSLPSIPSKPMPSPKHTFKTPQTSRPLPTPSPVQPIPSPATPMNSSWGYSDLMASNRNPNYLPTYTPPPAPPANQSAHTPLIPYALPHQQQQQQPQQSISTTGHPFHHTGGSISLSNPTSPFSLSTPSAHFLNPSPFSIPTHSTQVRPSLPSLPSPYTTSQMPLSLSNLLGAANNTAATPTTSSHVPGISDSSLNSLSGHVQQNLPPACYSQNALQQHQQQQQHYGSYDQLVVTCGSSELSSSAQTGHGVDYLRSLLCITNSDNSSSSRSNIMRITTCTSMQ